MKDYFKTRFSRFIDETTYERSVVRMNHGLKGYAVMMLIVERIVAETDARCRADMRLIAYELRTREELVRSLVEECPFLKVSDDGSTLSMPMFAAERPLTVEVQTKDVDTTQLRNALTTGEVASKTMVGSADNSGSSENSKNSDTSDNTENTENTENANKAENADKAKNSDNSESSENSDKPENAESSEDSDNSEPSPKKKKAKESPSLDSPKEKDKEKESREEKRKNDERIDKFNEQFLAYWNRMLERNNSNLKPVTLMTPTRKKCMRNLLKFTREQLAQFVYRAATSPYLNARNGKLSQPADFNWITGSVDRIVKVMEGNL